MTRARWDPPPGDESPDRSLDAVLARADAELLDHIRAHTDRRKALLAMMAASTAESRAAQVAPTHLGNPVRVPADHAVTVIAIRARSRDIDGALRQLRARGEIAAAALTGAQSLRDQLTAAEAVTGGATATSGPRRWPAFWVLVVSAFLSAVLGYAATAAMGGSHLASWLGAAISVVVLGALDADLAARPARRRTWTLHLAAGLGLWASCTVILRYTVLSAAATPVRGTTVAVVGVCAVGLVLASSLALRRAGLSTWLGWAKRRCGRPTAGALLHRVVGRLRARSRVAHEFEQLRAPVLHLAAAVKNAVPGDGFRTELAEIRVWVLEITTGAACSAAGDVDLQSFTSRLDDAIADVHTRAAIFDIALGQVLALLEQVKADFVQSSGWSGRKSLRKRKEVVSRVASLARDGVTAGAKATTFVDSVDVAIELNPFGYLATIEIDASGADLSAADVPDLTVLEGVIWTEETTWPPRMEGEVRSCSDVIGEGIYRVRNGSERDPVSLAGV